jgi:hypothetical protein
VPLYNYYLSLCKIIIRDMIWDTCVPLHNYYLSYYKTVYNSVIIEVFRGLVIKVYFYIRL